MAINWFPGHMHKARKEVAQHLPKMDLLIEVLDARIPYSSENPMIAKLRRDKPTIKVLTKTDLADPVRTQQWQDFLEQEQGVKTLALTTEQPDKIRSIIDLCNKMAPNKAEGVLLLNAMIVGIPNVGKSTIINVLAGRAITKTGNEPAVTKGQQMIKLGTDIMLHDTPGMLWPKLENQAGAYRLAVTGAIKDTAIDSADIAYFAAEFLRDHYPQVLAERYQFDVIPEEPMDILEGIAQLRGCMRAKGQMDLDRVSRLLITEIRAGTLGGLTFETPPMMAEEKAALAIQREAQAAKKATKKMRRKGTTH